MKKILIIGAGFLQSFVIKKAKNMGYETLAVDADPNAVGFQFADKYEVINIIDKKACLEYAQREKVNGVLTAATDYGVLTAAYIAKEMKLAGLNYEAAKLIKNKYAVRKRLIEEKVDDMEEIYEIDENTDLNMICKKVSFPVIVKPCDGSGSRGITRVDVKTQLVDACKMAMTESITHRAVIESFIVGKEYGVESMIVKDNVMVLGIMQKWMTDSPYYAEIGHAIPTDLSKEIEEKVEKCVKRAIKALGINFGSVNMDVLITEEGKIYIIDIGARMGGNMIGPCVIPYGKGVDYVANMIRSAVGDEINLNTDKSSAVATRLITFKDGVIGQLLDFEEIEKRYEVEIYHHLEVGQKVRDYHTNLDGCGYIIAKADDIETAICKVEDVLDLIREKIFMPNKG